MKIYLDFDGTVVEHTFPELGRCNFGCIEILEKLQIAGHEFILNTTRSEISEKSLQDALQWFENSWMLSRNKDIDIKISSFTKQKNHPHPWDWEEIKKANVMYIDDIALNIPLKPAVMTKSYMVDWDKLDQEFKENGLYE